MPFAFERSVLTRNVMPFFTVAAGSLGTINDNNRNTANNIITNPIATSQAGLPTHSIVSGSLPAGLTLNSNGTISGIATSVTSNTTSTFTVQATIEGASATRQYTITVNSFTVSGAINFNPVDTDAPGYGFPDAIYFSDMSSVETTNSIFPTTGTQNKLTFNIWLKPQSITGVLHFPLKVGVANSGEDFSWLQVDESGTIGMQFGTIGLFNWTRSVLTYNSWNHILVSIDRDHTASLSFGTVGGSTFDHGGTYRSYNSGSGQLFTIHVVVNGTAYHRYIDPAGAFFQNDFSTNNTTGSSLGYLSWSSTSSDLYTMSSTTNSIMGGFYGTGTSPTTGVGYYKGDMAEVWIKNDYYDLLDIENIRLFRNGSGKPVDPPASPSTYFKGYASSWASSGSLDEGTITKTNITDAGTLP